jgi:hypothetical protein
MKPKKIISELVIASIILSLSVILSLFCIAPFRITGYLYHIRFFDLIIILFAVPYLSISYGVTVAFVEP